MNEEDIKNLIRDEIKNSNGSSSQVGARRLYNGSDAERLDPKYFLGFPVIQVANATTSPVDTPQNGTFRFYVDTTPHYRLWAFLAYTSGGIVTSSWKSLTLV